MPEISVTAFVSRVNATGRSPASPSQSSSSGSGEQRLVIDRAAHLSHGLVLDLHDVLHALAQNHETDLLRLLTSIPAEAVARSRCLRASALPSRHTKNGRPFSVSFAGKP
jgi:hypothetical protein